MGRPPKDTPKPKRVQDPAQKAGLANLPKDLNAEKALLGSILADPSILPEAVQVLGSGDCFYWSTHHALFWLMVEMADEGLCIDLLTVSDRVLASGNPKRFGDLATWTGYAELAAGATLALSYARTIRRLADERALIAQTGKVIEGLQKGRDVGGLARELADMAAKGGPNPFSGSGIPSSTLPPQYEITASGRILYTTGTKRAEVSPALIAPRRLTVDADTGEYQVEVVWRDPSKGWVGHWVSREALADTQKLTRLARVGAPITAKNKGLVCEWLGACIQEWGASIEQVPTSSTLGWREKGFLWGSEIIGEVSARLDTTDPGRAQLVAGYKSAGTWQGWVDQVARPALAHPSTAIMLWASLVPALLKWIPDAPNFLVDLAGETSQGKTTALKIAASVWGDPSEQGGLVWSWDASPTWIERAASLCHGFPVILDDSKRARTSTVGQIVYAVAQGQGRGRATIEGLQKGAQWRTVLLSSGEQPLTAYCAADGGAGARVLTFWGSPLGSAREAQDIKAGVSDHHGHLGPRVVKVLLEELEQDPDCLRSSYRDLLAKVQDWLAERGAEGAVVQRVAAYMALLQLARQAALYAGLPEETCPDVWGSVLASVRASSTAADTAMKGLEVVTGYLAAHPDQVWTKIGGRPPSGGWLGRELSGGRLAVIATRLDEILSAVGLDAEGIRLRWVERGWVDAIGGRTTQNQKIDGRGVRCVVFTPEAMDLIGEGADEVEEKDLSEVL